MTATLGVLLIAAKIVSTVEKAIKYVVNRFVKFVRRMRKEEKSR